MESDFLISLKSLKGSSSAKGIISMIDFDIVKYKNHDLSKILKNTCIHRSMINSNDEIRYIKLKKKCVSLSKEKF